MAKQKLTAQLGARISEADSKNLDEVSETLGQPRPTVARAALRIGLDVLAKKPQRFLSPEARAATSS